MTLPPTAPFRYQSCNNFNNTFEERRDRKKNFRRIMNFKYRCFFPSMDFWVNKNVKKQRKQQPGGGEEKGEGRGVSSIIVSHIALLRMYFIVNFFLSVFVL